MNKKVLLGCGLAVLLVLLAFVLVVVMFGTKVASFAKDIIDESQDRAAWVAPAAGTTGEAMFPATLGGAQRRSIDRISGVATVNIQRDGERGSYVFPRGGKEFEVYAWSVNRAEVGGIFDRVGQAIDDGPYSTRVKMTLSNSEMRFSFSPPSTSGRLWFNKGWLFLFITNDGVELKPIEKEYLKAVESAGNYFNAMPLLPEADTSASAGQ